MHVTKACCHCVALCPVSHARSILIKKLLETDKDPADLLGPSKIGYGIGNGIMVFQTEQGSQFILIEFINADANVVGQNEIEENLLLAIKATADVNLGLGSSLLAGQW